MGTVLMFDHRTYARGYTYCSSYLGQPGAALLTPLPVLACVVRAHQFTQNALLKRPQACTQVPLGWTRASEYPTLVAPWLHGESHQSREECLAAFATGKPPRRWPHVYTGNVAQGAAMFRPALPALPAVPSTALARVLTGIDEFDAAPCATAWLLQELPGRGRQMIHEFIADGEKYCTSRSSTYAGSAAALAAEAATVADHQDLMLGDMLGSLRRRLRRLASGLEMSRLAATATSNPGYGLRVPELAMDATHAVPKAAQAARRDYSLARTERKRRAHATEA